MKKVPEKAKQEEDDFERKVLTFRDLSHLSYFETGSLSTGLMMESL